MRVLSSVPSRPEEGSGRVPGTYVGARDIPGYVGERDQMPVL